MGRQERNWHPSFEEYMNFIVKHPNYDGMPNPYKKDGNIRWVIAGNSLIGRERREWWDNKRERLGFAKDRGWLAKTAEAVHPTGKKVCQICGREMSIHYVYPRNRYLSKLQKIPGLDVKFTFFNEVSEIFETICNQIGEIEYYHIGQIFKIPNSIPKNVTDYTNFLIEKCKTKLSPAAMIFDKISCMHNSLIFMDKLFYFYDSCCCVEV